MKNILQNSLAGTRALCLFAAVLTLSSITNNGRAQVSTNYAFASSTSLPYTYITGGTVVGGPNDDDDYYLANIGFTFNYNGSGFTQLWIDANGFITFGGSSTPPTSTYYFGPPLAYNVNCIAAFSNDLQGDSLSTSEMRIQTLGIAPFRTCFIQWRDWGAYGSSGISSPSTAERYNFQIQLDENNGNGIASVHYGGFVTSGGSTTISAAPTGAAVVGITGTSTSDFNDRTSTGGWASTLAGSSNTVGVAFSATSKPDSGRVFTWAIPPIPMVIDSVSTVQVTDGVFQGTNNNPIIAAVAYTHGNANYKTVSSLSFNTSGTNHPADILHAKVHYTE